MTTRREFIVRTAAAGALGLEQAHGTRARAKMSGPATAGSLRTCKIPNTDLSVSRIAYGCADLVPWDKGALETESIAKADRVINVAYDHGITFFDTADIYSYGKAESALGEALKRSPRLRGKIVIQSKCGLAQYGDPPCNDSSGEHIVSSVERSLKRLGTDYLDILLLHVPDSLVEPEEVAQAFAQLKRNGRVRYFGVSNHVPSQIQVLKRNITEPLVVNQVPLGIGHSKLITEYGNSTGTLDYCRVSDMQVQAYSPLRGGFLSTSWDTPPEIKEFGQVVEELAAAKGATSAAIALAWLLRHPANIVPIIGSTNPEHVVEDCKADEITLTRKEWYSLFVAADKLQGTRQG